MNFGLPGGAVAPAWGGEIKLHCWVALATGSTWTLGPDPHDRFDRGNVLAAYVSGATPTDPTPAVPGGLWVDVSCDVVSADVQTGATKADGVFARAEAGTATIVLSDADRQFDPVNPSSRWTFQGESRLTPGCPILLFAEALQYGMLIVRHTLFVGRVESWREPWTPHRSERRCTLTCVDATADLVARKRPELTVPVGAGDTVDARLQRILTYHDGPALLADPSTVTLDATTFPGSCWDQLNAAVENEVGFVHVTPYYADPLDALDTNALVGVRFLARSVWSDPTGPTVVVTCPMVITATVAALDLDLRNAVTAARRTGTPVVARDEVSVARYGEHDYDKTDLQLADDTQVATWADLVLSLFAYPQPSVTDVTLRPSNVPGSWPTILGVDLVAERIRVDWTPPDTTTTYHVTGRVVGVAHAITWDHWDVKWTLGATELTV